MTRYGSGARDRFDMETLDPDGLTVADYEKSRLPTPPEPQGGTAGHYTAVVSEGEFDWAAKAACKDIEPRLFFPSRGEDAEPGKQVCRSCPVRVECLEYAVEHREQHGIWGGYSERERRQMRKFRAASRRVA
jgi:WhiB family redox-sensing transcriptional regulator